nr:immunoglobulin light chain junction region [Macaca mulatta]MOW52996.1 immunoglobulin light chain junction region [Macaca mulatta]MOW53052.1 immunoglobulin light chain junction region [Macaca mulatta]MOW53343.1 immunoglobulin light chain junction region [Macaca mulatta]MOW53861.1 immunoglobulin light chain junction region [Macaca mulatta]
CQQYNTDPSF